MQLILEARHIKKQYGVRTVLDFENFSVYAGDRIGIVGLNGAGKTTLLGILSGDIKPDEGMVRCETHAAYIRQFEENDTMLSGGENTKKRILRETLHEDGIIFADEPTANLDADGVKWVRQKLESANTVVLISHDRQLLDDICTRIVEIEDGKLTFYTGNYSDYKCEAALAKRRREQELDEYINKKEQLTDAIEVRRQKVARQKKQKKQELKKNSSEARLGGHKRNASMQKQERAAKVLEARLDRLEKPEKLKKLPKFRVDFSLTDPPQGKTILTCDNLSFSYGDRVIFDHAAFAVPTGRKIAVTGRNGAGKTTLLNLIYNRDPQILAAPKLKPGYLRQGFENVRDDKTVLENALYNSVQDRASVFSILSGLLFFGGDFDKPAGVLSGGEKIRLSLAMLIASDCNAILLDEPTNYLDIRSIEAIAAIVSEYPGTVLIVSHDARFLSETAEMELQVENGKIIAKP